MNSAIVGVKEVAPKNWYSERYMLPEDAEMLHDGYSDEHVYARFPMGEGVMHHSRPVDFYDFLRDPAFQRILDKRIKRISGGNAVNWTYRGERYRFSALGELFYSIHTNKACRHGVLFRESGGRNKAWDKIPSTFCKIGPNGEWLPLV